MHRLAGAAAAGCPRVSATVPDPVVPVSEPRCLNLSSAQARSHERYTDSRAAAKQGSDEEATGIQSTSRR